MNLRFIEAQNARKAELKRLADIKEKQLKEALEASKKLASMQRDSERQWIVSTPITTDAVYETLFGNLTPTVHIHPISGETIRRPTAPYSSEPIRGNTEGYTHFDVQWTTTLPPFPRQANSHDIEQFRNILAHDYFGILPEEVWQIIKKHLPILKIDLQNIISVE